MFLRQKALPWIVAKIVHPFARYIPVRVEVAQDISSLFIYCVTSSILKSRVKLHHRMRAPGAGAKPLSILECLTVLA
jgi:hypothetical protein